MENQVFYLSSFNYIKKFQIIKLNNENNENVVKITYFGNNWQPEFISLSNKELEVYLKSGHSSYEEALEKDREIKDFMIENEIEYIGIPAEEESIKLIVEDIKRKLSYETV